jgi:hypothetical protein
MVKFWYVPAGQIVQLLEPFAAANSPRLHSAQFADEFEGLTLDAFPAGQLVQLWLRAEDHVPAAQVVQVASPARA